MRGSTTAAAACCLITALCAFSVSSVHALPAPEPGTVELTIGASGWATEVGDAQPLNKTEALLMKLELARQDRPTNKKTDICETLAAAAQETELPVGFFVRLINQESGFNPKAVSPVGAQGVAQFMPRVAEEWGLANPFDPHSALVASARFLRSLYDQFGNWGLAAAAYNGGMGRVQKWIDKRGKLPDETRHYVMTITGVPADKWADGKPKDAKFSIPKRAPCQEIAHLADPPVTVVPMPPVRVAQVQITGGSPTRTVNNVTIAKGKGDTKVAVIKVGGSKAATITGKIAAPKPIIAEAAKPKATATAKAKTPVAVKVADKTAKPAAKPAADAKPQKKGKERVRVADASK